MIINCFYDEDMDYADIIYIPDSIEYSIDVLQAKFFKWLFDKNNNHKYWVIINGEKKACKYGTDAFVDWVNDMCLINASDNAYVIEENAEIWDTDNKNLIF